MSKPRVPFVSPLVNPHESDIVSTFGNTWRERVGDVRGFRIGTTTVTGNTIGIMRITNLFEVAVENAHLLVASDQMHYFLLLPDEFVVQLDVYSKEQFTVTKGNRSTITPGQVYGLRFRTNKRVSEWFGATVGALKVFASPDGCFVRALHGSLHRIGCGQVGVVYAPVEPPAIAANPDVYVLTERVKSSGVGKLSFRVQCETPRAIVVRLDKCNLRDIAVVSQDQYDALTELGPVENDRYEHWLVLAEDERILAVGVGAQGDDLVAIRFRTSVRSTVWFGTPTSSDVTWLESPPGTFISGFQVEGQSVTSCWRVTALSAVYKALESESAEKKPASAECASKAA